MGSVRGWGVIAVVAMSVGCGASVAPEPGQGTPQGTQPSDPTKTAVAVPEFQRSIKVRTECVETDESLSTCQAAGAYTSWTAPGSCKDPDVTPGIPQKIDADGTVREREGSYCCGFVRLDSGVTALCCADFEICGGRRPED